MASTRLHDRRELRAVIDAAVVLPPRELVGVVLQMTARNSAIDAALAASNARVEALHPIRMDAVDHVADGMIDGLPVGEVGGEDLPRCAFVGSDLCGRIDKRENCRKRLSFVLADEGDRATTVPALTHVHDDLTLLPVPAPVATILFQVGGFDVSADHDAVDLDDPRQLCRLLQRAEDLAELVREDEGRLVGDAEIAAQAQRGMAIHAIHEHRNRHQEIAVGHLATMEDGAGCERELLVAALTLEDATASELVDTEGATMGTEGLTVVLGKPHGPESLIGVIVRHAGDFHEAQGSGLGREEEC